MEKSKRKRETSTKRRHAVDRGEDKATQLCLDTRELSGGEATGEQAWSDGCPPSVGSGGACLVLLWAGPGGRALSGASRQDSGSRGAEVAGVGPGLRTGRWRAVCGVGACWYTGNTATCCTACRGSVPAGARGNLSSSVREKGRPPAGDG